MQLHRESDFFFLFCTHFSYHYHVYHINDKQMLRKYYNYIRYLWFAMHFICLGKRRLACIFAYILWRGKRVRSRRKRAKSFVHALWSRRYVAKSSRQTTLCT